MLADIIVIRNNGLRYLDKRKKVNKEYENIFITLY